MNHIFYFNTVLKFSIALIITLQINNDAQAKDQSTIFESQYEDVSVLVTGGCGFIGSHLVEKLVELGAQVTILDNLSSGKEENIATIADKVTLINGSITDFETCLIATKNKQIVFHLAAFVSVPASTENPQDCHEINIIGTGNMLEAARINNVKRFVFSSTCAVYGESSSECCEDKKPNPTSPYGFSKLMGEMYCKEYAKVYEMETVWMRYFNVYGPRQDPHSTYAGVIAKFTHNMEYNLPLVIFGDGTQTRDYVHVQDIVKANLILGICDKEYIQGEVFNIATEKSTSVLELVNALKQQYPSYKEEILFMPARPGDVKHIAADCSKYKQLYHDLLFNGDSSEEENK